MEINKRIGDYEVLEELGRGGMGRVYRVRNVISERIEAMKVLLPDLVGQQDLASRFLREIKLLAALNHPNIAALRTALTADNQLVMIMEYVDGQSLSQRLRMGPIPTADALSYVDQVLDALSYAHQQHVIHRDIKPANMMLTSDGVVKLTDFGIARSRNDATLTAAGTTTGSLSYMSPEQVNGEPTDGRSDLYSVGISLYEMVTGQRPFQADSDFAVMVAHLKEVPRPPIEILPSLGPELNTVILTAIAKSPKARYQTADDFRAALHSLPAMAGLAAASLSDPLATVVNRPEAKVPPASVSAATVTPISPDRIRTLIDAPPAVQPGAAIPPVPVPPPVMRKPANATLYMAIGGVLVIGALAAAGWYIGTAQADPGPETEAAAPAPTPPATPAAAISSATSGPSASTAVATTPAATPAEASAATSPSSSAATAATSAATAPATSLVATPAGSAPLTSEATSSGTRARPLGTARPGTAGRRLLRGGTPARANVTESTATAAVQPTEPAVDFDELERELDQLVARAAAVNRSLDTLQQQQARQGLGLRGDIAARQQTMNTNLTRAQEALNQRNQARYQRFRAMADADVEALERFLGR